MLHHAYKAGASVIAEALSMFHHYSLQWEGIQAAFQYSYGVSHGT